MSTCVKDSLRLTSCKMSNFYTQKHTLTNTPWMFSHSHTNEMKMVNVSQQTHVLQSIVPFIFPWSVVHSPPSTQNVKRNVIKLEFIESLNISNDSPSLISYFHSSFPVFFLFLSAFGAGSVCRRVSVGSGVVQEHLVEAFKGFSQVILQSREGGADGWRTKTVRDEAKVWQAALDSWLQDGRRPRVS